MTDSTQKKRSVPWTKLLLALVSLALVLAATLWESEERISPGPLHASHAKLPELQRARGCDECHGNFLTTMAEACLDCHDPIGDQLAAGEGLHGMLDNATAESCEECHTEHTDGAIPLVRPASFEVAGIVDVSEYDHKHIPAFALIDRHNGLDCRLCHPLVHATALEPGERRYLGLSQDCAACHDDVHDGSFGQDCASCHGQAHSFPDAPLFAHDASFALADNHAGLECATCHEPQSPYAVARLLDAPVEPRDCADCHDDVHQGSFGLDCTSCHDAAHSFQEAPGFTHDPLITLTGGHADASCLDCHDPTSDHSVTSLRDARADLRQCSDCHESPHHGAFIAEVARLSSITDSESCEVCHSAAHTSFHGHQPTMTNALHAATGFALDLPHDSQDCAECHQDFGKSHVASSTQIAFASAYPGRNANDCRACHDDPHLGQFDLGFSKGRCLDCHVSTHFKPSAFDLHQHAQSQFPLTGAHQAIACASCHEHDTKPVQFVPTATNCSSCHDDVHDGFFDGPGKPAIVAKQSDCARCHETSSFSEVEWTPPDHATWTDYALEGAHATASCTDCHTPAPRDAEGLRRFGIAEQDCNACHSDPHGRQFAVAGTIDCARCHDNATSFAIVNFEHDRLTRHPLDEQHATLDCATCHRPVDVGGGNTIVRYRPLGTSCSDCHGFRYTEKGETR